MKTFALIFASLPVLVTLFPAYSDAAQPKMQKKVRQGTDSTVIHLDQCSGTPQHYASGMLYGISGTDTPPGACK